MDSSTSFKGKPQFFDMVPSAPSSRREFEVFRSRNKFLKRSATFSYLLLQMAIVIACVAICVTPFWMKCHFFFLTPELTNGTKNPLSPASQGKIGQLASEQVHNENNNETTTTVVTEVSSSVETTSIATTRGTPKAKGKRESTTTTASTSATSQNMSKHRRRAPIPPSDNATIQNENNGTLFGDNDSMVLRHYISADIGLWETCQLGQCQAYNTVWKIFFEIDPSTWWLFICRWMCIAGVAFTEILWLLVAILRFVLFNRRNRRRPSRVDYRNRGLKNGDPNAYTPEPIAGVLLLLIKAVTVIATAGCLITFRWHTNVQWPVEMRVKTGVIAHMGVSWLGMIAMGSCDVWLFLVTLLHTIASRRDRRRAEQAAAAKNRSNNVFTTAVNAVRRRRSSIGACGQRCGRQFCAHGPTLGNSQDDSNLYYSPSATNNNFYRPTPYEDDCDYGFNTMPLSRKQSVRRVNSNLFDDCSGFQQSRLGANTTSTQARNGNNGSNLMTSHRTPGRAIHYGRNMIHHNLAEESPDMPNSPLYIPHYDDEAIGGRAFY